MHAPVVQWIEQFRPKEEIQVRFLVGAPKESSQLLAFCATLSILIYHNQTTT